MATFTLTGHSGTRTLALTWTDGAVTGEPDAVQFVRALADGYEGSLCGQPGGPYTTTQHLTSPYTARALMAQAFTDRPVLTDGALPAIPDPPEGAIR